MKYKTLLALSLALSVSLANARESIPTQPGWYALKNGSRESFRPVSESIVRKCQIVVEDAFDDNVVRGTCPTKSEKVAGDKSSPWSGTKWKTCGVGDYENGKAVLENARDNLVAVAWWIENSIAECKTVVHVYRPIPE